jgi:hypothetical protein
MSVNGATNNTGNKCVDFTMTGPVEKIVKSVYWNNGIAIKTEKSSTSNANFVAGIFDKVNRVYIVTNDTDQDFRGSAIMILNLPYLNQPVQTITENWTIGGTNYVDADVAAGILKGYFGMRSSGGAGSSLITNDQVTGKTASFTYTLPADALLTLVDVYANSGSPTVSIGSTLAGTDIMTATALTAGQRSGQELNMFFSISATQTIYVTISGTGTIAANFTYYTNRF